MKNLISIIIPNYNRADLIGETLDSIIEQTYKNWECIIVDDGSTDNSIAFIKTYEEKDNRFKLYTRPKDYPKGANACRNIGLKNIQSDYVIFFDSDDLMEVNHIEIKLKNILKGSYDFVVAKSKYFNNPENKNPINYRKLDSLPITADNFITKKINWLTLDLIIKSSIAKSIMFTEKNQSAEEYNYFVKLVLTTNNAIVIKNVLTLRRYHEGSYQVNLDNEYKRIKNQFFYYYDTYSETFNSEISKSSKIFLINNAIEIAYRNKNIIKEINKKHFYKKIIFEFGFFKGLNKIRLLEFH